MIKKLTEKIIPLFKNTVFQNVILVSGITLLIKFVSLFKESLIAANFGLSQVLDTFLIAMIIPGFVNAVFLGSFKNVFIPNYIAEQKTGNKIGSFQATGFVLTFLVSLFFVLVSYLSTDVFLEYIFPGHEENFYALIREQLNYVLPCILFWGLSSLLGGLLNINDEFRLSTFANIMVPATIIICLFFFKDYFGTNVLAIATLIGSSLSFLYLLLISQWKRILQFAKPDLANSNARLMLAQVPAKVSSSFLSGLHNVINSFFAAQLIVGSISALNYGIKIPMFAVGIIVLGLSNVLLPYFSKQVISNKAKAYQTLFRLLKTLFAGAAVVALIGILASDFLVSLFFERNEFSAADAEIVSKIQKIILIYLPFRICGRLLISFLTSINKNNYQAIVALASVILNVILNVILIDYYGVFGIAIATTIVIAFRNIALFAFTLRQYKLSKVG